MSRHKSSPPITLLIELCIRFIAGAFVLLFMGACWLVRKRQQKQVSSSSGSLPSFAPDIAARKTDGLVSPSPFLARRAYQRLSHRS